MPRNVLSWVLRPRVLTLRRATPIVNIPVDFLAWRPVHLHASRRGSQTAALDQTTPLSSVPSRYKPPTRSQSRPNCTFSLNTVKTHMRNLYAKLGTHRRHEAVERARALGLLAPSTRLR
jgi:Bacterial regulatory proteins, luxR family